MAVVALKPSTAGLTEKQAAFVIAYCDGKTAGQAALDAGYSASTQGYAILKLPEIRAAIRDFNERAIETDLAAMAVRTVKELMLPGNPASVRLGASQLTLKMARYLDNTPDSAEKDVNAMTPDELAEQIGRLDAALAKHADAAIPVKTQVIEHNPPSGG